MKPRVGQKIMFELCNTKDYKNLPRWWWNEDQGKTGNWATGVIETIEIDRITVAYTIHKFMGTGHCHFPNIMHDKYKEEQWTYDGYLQCGECDCGAITVGYNIHSHWCTAETFNRRKDGL